MIQSASSPLVSLADLVMSGPNEVDDDLLGRARGGDEASAAELFRRWTPALQQLAEGRGLSTGDAASAVAETLREARQRLAEFQGTSEADTGAWLQAMLTHLLLTASRASAGPASSYDTLAADGTKKPVAAAAGDPHATLGPHRQATVRLDPHATIVGPSPLAPTAPTSRKMFGDYEILDTIARGGMGIVYKARQRKLNRVVALKMILAGQFADQADVERFYVEAEAAGNLRHPNIVGIHEVGECEGQHFFSMDYIEGHSLADMVREHALTPRRAAEYVRVISDAIHHAHQHGILHRDLKPSNVLVDHKDAPMVTDFGLAKRTEGQSQLTISGTIVGTPAYMPPEQASGKLDAISVRSDVYSLGGILYELLTGRPPFVSANPFETIKQVLESDPVAPRLLNSNIPVDLETICLKCLQKEAERRYGSAQELADELQRYLSGEPILARPVGAAERLWRWCRRNPRVAGSLGVTALTLIMASIVSSVLYMRAEKAYRQTERALAKAEASIDQMRLAIDELYRIISEEDLLNEPGFKPLRQKILSQARDLYRQALDRLGDDPKIQEDMAVSLFSLGRILRELQEPQEALEPLSKARGIQEALLAATPQDTRRLRHLGNTLNLIGQVYENQRRLIDALEVYEQAIRLRRDLVQREPSNREFERQLMNSQMNSGLIHKKIFDQGDATHYELAMERLRESQSSRDALLQATPHDAKLHLDLAMGSYNLASLTFQPLEQLREEISLLQDELAAMQAAAAPDRPAPTRDLESRIAGLRERAQPWRNQTATLLQTAFGELDVLQAADAATRLVGYRQIDQFQLQQLRAYCLLLDAYLTEDDDRAAQSVDKARNIVETLVREHPESHEFLGMLGGVYMLLGDLHFKRFEDQQALQAYGRAIEQFGELVRKVPGAARYAAQLQAAQERLQEMQGAITTPEGGPDASGSRGKSN